MNYLEALEDERFETLGGHVYVKGFLRSYAGYLGLDPAPLIEAYRAQEQPQPPRAPRPVALDLNRRGPNWVAIGIVCTSIILVYSLWLLVRPEHRPPTPGQGVATPVATTAPAPAPTSPRSATTVAPATTAPAKPVTVVARYTQPSWTSVRADGTVMFRGIVPAGQQRVFSADRSVDLILGNPGGVQLTVNGKALGVPSRGGTWRHVFGPGNPGTVGG